MNFVMTLGVVLAGFWFDAAAAQEGYFGHDHDRWHHGFYQTLERPDTKSPCCNVTDCRPTSGISHDASMAAASISPASSLSAASWGGERKQLAHILIDLIALEQLEQKRMRAAAEALSLSRNGAAAKTGRAGPRSDPLPIDPPSTSRRSPIMVRVRPLCGWFRAVSRSCQHGE